MQAAYITPFPTNDANPDMPRGDLAEIGKYRIVSQIGEGAMGVVYRGIDPVLNRSVAIKVMNDAVARDKELRARFLREAQSAGSLQHPNVVTVYDFGEVDGHPFIAMELVEGTDLDELLRRNAPLTLVEKIDILIDVLNGLSYAHKRGIVHRDVKPANIRIDEEGRARIMDFGIAHMHTSGATRMTRTGVMVGTPAYMSPEQITGAPITPSSDIFSIGAVMYELLAGITAFQAETLQSMMYQIVTVPAPELIAIVPFPSGPDGPHVAKLLDSIAGRALAKEPAGRYETATDMAMALSDVRARLVDGHQHVAGPASLRASVAKAMAAVPESPRPVRKRHGMMIAGVAGIATSLIIVILFARRTPAAVNIIPAPPPVAPASTPGTTPNAAPSASASIAEIAPATKTDSAPTSARELALIRDLRTTALAARRRAVEAGASAASLDSGDAHNRVATTLIAQGKASDAGMHLTQATAAWNAAERAARVATAGGAVGGATGGATNAPANVAANTAASISASVTNNAPRIDVPKPLTPPSTIPSASVAQQSLSTVPATQPTQPAAPANPSVEIGAVVASYARALESRDVATVRRAYPGLTTSQSKGWEQFFSTLRSLRVALTMNGLDVSGSSADAKIAGTYDYVTDAGKSVQQAVSFLATFRREGGTWQLVSVH